MLRTYRSKKETAGGVDRKDLLQNLNEKSSAFDAFYIQNIKQTKRDLSSVGSSNPYGVASNKVRKRKYVRRIVKEVEPLPRESLPNSAYLTPDKSLRVNKPLDPFDMLLNSSPACPVESVGDKAETVTAKVDLFDEFAAKKESKTYVRRKQIKAKKFNYSSSEESDKENSDEKINITKNTSNIKTHQLLVEQENNGSPKHSDDSINNIINNISLLNRIQHKNSFNDTMRKSFIFNRNRLTRNNQSPILQKSPFCSTPFKAKYRGESIYKFSPIPVSVNDKKPKVDPIPEVNDNNCSVIFLSKGNISLKASQDHTQSHIKNVSINHSIEEPNRDIADEIIEVEAVSPAISNRKCGVVENKIHQEITANSTECSSLQTTEIEPFIGFSNPETSKDENHEAIEIKIAAEGVPLDESNITEIEVHDSINNENSIINSTGSEYNDDTNDTSDDNDSSEVDQESLYDTCSSERSVENVPDFREPVVQLERMNDSSFLRYYEKMPGQSHDEDDTDNYNNLDSEEYASFNNSNNSDNYESLYKIVDNLSENETDNSGVDVASSNDDDTESNSHNDEEKCISFVTTRRRNELTNNSMMSIFNDSYGSTSTECNKTVLSNEVENNEKNTDNTLNNITKKCFKDPNCNEIKSNTMYEEVIPGNQNTDVAEESRISFITTRKSSIQARSSISRKTNKETRESSFFREDQSLRDIRKTCFDVKQGIVLQPGKKWERSLSIYRRITMLTDHFDQSILEDEPMETKGRKYRQSVISTMEMQELQGSLHNESINSRRSTFVSKPSRSTIRIVKDSNISRLSVCNSTAFDDLKGYLNEEWDDTVVELSKLSIAEQTHEVTVIDNFHDTSGRVATARDYVLRRCNQTEAILFDECYPDTVLKNCHKIGEGVYGEVFLWRDRDGRARVLKIVPIAGNIKVNGESQKDFHEIISEIVIAMELSALRAPIAEIERHFDEGKEIAALDLHAIENATDVFNEVLAVKCVYGSYPSRLLDLWDLYDECKGSENDNPAILPVDQQYIVLELANAGQDLESYQFNNAEQAYALFLQVAYGLAVAEEAFQFEHRDLHWGNVLIAPTEQKFATFIIRGRAVRVPRRGVAATVIDYSLSRVALPLGSDCAALYNDLAADDGLFDAVGDYQFEIYRLMRDKLGNDWKNYEPYTNILWLHYTVDKMITALRYKRTNTKIHKHYIEKLKGIKSRILDYGSAALFVLTDNEI